MNESGRPGGIAPASHAAHHASLDASHARTVSPGHPANVCAIAAPHTPFPPRRDFSSLSVADLLEARAAHHVQLASLENVVATAIGRYLIREDDWYATHSPDVPRPADHPKPSGPRTLDNSVIRAWSWPAVLVFVRRWADAAELGPDTVPRALYLPDGRVIPTCVIEAAPDASALPPAPGPAQASPLLGGGYACVRNDQGVARVGTFGCLVYREGTVYALTSRHVAGDAGSEIDAYVDGHYHRVGVSAAHGLTRIDMAQALPGFAAQTTRRAPQLNYDAGLVRVDDIGAWTSQAFGIGEIDEPFDATAHTLTLDLIGTPVRAFGAVSGVMEGEIRALFFQYRGASGMGTATDVLIGASRTSTASGVPKTAPFTRPGDSGTLWFYDPPSAPPAPCPDLLAHAAAPVRGAKARRLKPLAMQWGGERFLRADGSSSAFALGSFLSTVCRELDLDIVRDWSTGHDEYWGKLGHFAIGWKACEHVDGKLGTLMQANQARIGFGDDTLDAGSAFKMGRDAYVPLADVPDYVWIGNRKRADEPIQHFADVDIQDIDGGPSMLQRCHDDPASVSATAWLAYFDGFKAAGVGPDTGALPFRVWQIWTEMVGYLKGGDALRFVAAAGVLAHYVGDASQPLHCSYLHHGELPMTKYDGREYPVLKDSDEYKAFSKTPEAKIHGLYEETMLEVDTATVLADINAQLAGASPKLPAVTSGYDAARATLALMYDAQQRLSPQDIIDADDPSLTGPARARRLWSNVKVRNETIVSLAQSVRVLAWLWHSAWDAGNGDALGEAALVTFGEDALSQIYRYEASFLPSLSLADMAKSGEFEPPAAAQR